MDGGRQSLVGHAALSKEAPEVAVVRAGLRGRKNAYRPASRDGYRDREHALGPSNSEASFRQFGRIEKTVVIGKDFFCSSMEDGSRDHMIEGSNFGNCKCYILFGAPGHFLFPDYRFYVRSRRHPYPAFDV